MEFKSLLDQEMKSESDDSDYNPNNDEDDCLGDDEYKSENDSSDENSPHAPVKIIDDLIRGRIKPKENEDNGDKDENKNAKIDQLAKQFEATNYPLDTESYRIWKKNCPFLYDLVMTNQLEWPSYTVDWCNHKQIKVNPINYREYYLEKLLYGTHVDEHHTNYIIVATQQVPVDEEKEVSEDVSVHTKYLKLDCLVKIYHDGNVNRARYNLENHFVIATASSSGKNYIFDYSKHPSEPFNKDFKPELILDHHEKEGYGLCWNPHQFNILATGSLDETICIWDLKNVPAEGKTLKPINSFKAHDLAVNDVKWNYYCGSILGSVGADKMLKIWDLRISTQKTSCECRAHHEDINSLSFNRFCEYVVLTASDDGTVAMFDIRNLKHKLHTFVTHHDQVFDVNWSPYIETIFASSGNDGRLIIWDITKVGDTQTPIEKKVGPPEMIFIHGGHTSPIQDFAWHPHNQSIASVSDSNELHIFKPSIELKAPDSSSNYYDDSHSINNTNPNV